MAHGWQQGLVFGPRFIFIWLYLGASEDVFPCNCCKNFHSNLHGYCNAHRFSRFHHKFFSRCHLVPTAAEDVMGRSSFWATKLDPERNGSSMFLLLVIRSKSGSRDENHPAVERASLVQVGRFSLICVGFDEHPKITGHRHARISLHYRLYPHFHPLVSNKWVACGIMGYHVSCTCWRCHHHPLSLCMWRTCFFPDPFSNAFFGMIHFFLLHFDMSMSSMSSEHWGLSVVGTGGDFLGAGCCWYRIKSLAGFDRYLFVTMQHLKSSNINLL